MYFRYTPYTNVSVTFVKELTAATCIKQPQSYYNPYTWFLHPFCRTTPYYSMGPFFHSYFYHWAIIITSHSDPFVATHHALICRLMSTSDDQIKINIRQADKRQKHLTNSPKKNLHSVGSQQPAGWYCEKNWWQLTWLNNGNQMNNNVIENY